MNGNDISNSLYAAPDNKEDYSDCCPKCSHIETPITMQKVKHGYKGIFCCSTCRRTWTCFFAKAYPEFINRL